MGNTTGVNRGKERSAEKKKMVLLENDNFLSELTRMFARGREKGSIVLTMKKYDGRDKPKPRKPKSIRPGGAAASSSSESVSEYKCLLRAQLSSRKISTVVSSKDVNKFVLAYNSLLKGNMDGLKKREKSKEKKKAAAAAASSAATSSSSAATAAAVVKMDTSSSSSSVNSSAAAVTSSASNAASAPNSKKTPKSKT